MENCVPDGNEKKEYFLKRFIHWLNFKVWMDICNEMFIFDTIWRMP